MRCKYCGSSVEENDAFCKTCGRSLSADADPIQPEAPAQEEIQVVEPAVTANDVKEAVKNSRNSLAISSLIIGILSFCCCSIFTVPSGIILAALGLNSNKKGMAIAGMILNILAAVVFVIYFILGFVMAIEHGSYVDFEAFGF